MAVFTAFFLCLYYNSAIKFAMNFFHILNMWITVKIISTTIIQIAKLVNNCFSLEFDCKKEGRTNKSTPII